MLINDVYAPSFTLPLRCTVMISDHLLINSTPLKVLQSHVALERSIDATRPRQSQ
jgi:hypothetical protein